MRTGLATVTEPSLAAGRSGGWALSRIVRRAASAIAELNCLLAARQWEGWMRR